jgi:hypothetical protein
MASVIGRESSRFGLFRTFLGRIDAEAPRKKQTVDFPVVSKNAYLALSSSRLRWLRRRERPAVYGRLSGAYGHRLEWQRTTVVSDIDELILGAWPSKSDMTRRDRPEISYLRAKVPVERSEIRLSDVK